MSHTFCLFFTPHLQFARELGQAISEHSLSLINSDLVRVEYNAKPGRALVRDRHLPGTNGES
jgi:hypothetical protein